MGDPGNVFTIAVGGGRSEHPTPMPMELALKLVRLGSAPGDLVVDPFAGGGTTLVAARDLSRAYVGFEIVPEYARAARRRLRRARSRETPAGREPAAARSLEAALSPAEERRMRCPTPRSR
jgi:DNA modification methylase